MTKSRQHFKQYLKAFIQRALSACKEEYLKNKQKYEGRVPMADFSGRTLSITHRDTIDYKKLSLALKTSIKKYPEANSLFKIIRNILKSKINQTESKNTNKTDVDYNGLDSQLFYCIFHYLKNYGFEFDESNFNETFSAFDQYLHLGFDNYCYLTPLYNFDGDFEHCQISSCLWIQKIPISFYSKIINLNLGIREIPSYQRQLKYALFCSVGTKTSPSPPSTALKNFENTLNALKLFERGDPSFGDVFGILSKDWPGYSLSIIERGHERSPYSSRKYRLDEKKAKDFAHFHEKLFGKISKLDRKSGFLESSIRRFGMAFHHREPVDKIVDHVICLESLLVPNVGDATLKLSHRMSSLLGDNDAERVWIWKFAKEAYKFRSGYLHKSKERPIKIDSHNLELDEVSAKLECLSQLAIMRVIQLLHKYDSQDQIVDELDQSMYDRGKLKKLQRVWKH